MDTLSLLLDDIHLAGVEFRYLDAGAPWGFAFHSKGLASFHLLLSGSAFLHFPNEAPIALQAGDMAIVTSGRDHTVTDPDTAPSPQFINLADTLQGHGLEPMRIGQSPITCQLLSARFSFDADMARPLLAALPSLLLLRSTGDQLPEWLRIGLAFIAQESRGRPAHQTIINRVGDILFCESVRDYVESLPLDSNNWLLALRDPALSAALSAMHRQPEKPWTVPELAAVACLSRSSFAERFGQVMGKPPLSYLAEHRMRLAVWQLKHTQQPICRIAEMVGYGSETAFSQAFKRFYSCPPSQFRQQSRGG